MSFVLILISFFFFFFRSLLLFFFFDLFFSCFSFLISIHSIKLLSQIISFSFLNILYNYCKIKVIYLFILRLLTKIITTKEITTKAKQTTWKLFFAKATPSFSPKEYRASPFIVYDCMEAIQIKVICIYFYKTK